MRDFARFGTIYTIKKRKKHPWNSVTFRKVTLEIYWSLTADMGVSHVFKIVQMIPNRAKYHKQ